MLLKLKPKWSKMIKDLDLKDLANAERLRRVLEHVKKGDDHYILKDNDEPQAALLSLDDLEFLKEAKNSRERAWENLFANLKAVHEKNKEFSAEETENDIDEAIKAVRQGQK